MAHRLKLNALQSKAALDIFLTLRGLGLVLKLTVDFQDLAEALGGAVLKEKNRGLYLQENFLTSAR